MIRTEIHIIKNRCKGCGICIEICQNKILEISEETNKYGYHPPTVKNQDECTNCGLCEMFCPDFAIWVVSQESVQT